MSHEAKGKEGEEMCQAVRATREEGAALHRAKMRDFT